MNLDQIKQTVKESPMMQALIAVFIVIIIAMTYSINSKGSGTAPKESNEIKGLYNAVEIPVSWQGDFNGMNIEVYGIIIGIDDETANVKAYLKTNVINNTDRPFRFIVLEAKNGKNAYLEKINDIVKIGDKQNGYLVETFEQKEINEIDSIDVYAVVRDNKTEETGSYEIKIPLNR